MSAPSHTTETIERELANLGEAPPTAEELALVEHADHLDHDQHVASVARLAELAEPIAFDDLSELETHRSWRRVELRLAQSSNQSPTLPTIDDDREASPGGKGSRRWLFAALGLAAAAAVLLIVVRPFEAQQIAKHTEPDAQLVTQLGEQARAALLALDDGTSDTERAEQLAADYQLQLEEQGG